MDASLEKRLKRQVIGKPHRFLAIAPLGFEQTLVAELKKLNIEVSSDNEGDLKNSANTSSFTTSTTAGDWNPSTAYPDSIFASCCGLLSFISSTIETFSSS